MDYIYRWLKWTFLNNLTCLNDFFWIGMFVWLCEKQTIRDWIITSFRLSEYANSMPKWLWSSVLNGLEIQCYRKMCILRVKWLFIGFGILFLFIDFNEETDIFLLYQASCYFFFTYQHWAFYRFYTKCVMTERIYYLVLFIQISCWFFIDIRLWYVTENEFPNEVRQNSQYYFYSIDLLKFCCLCILIVVSLCVA